MPEAAKQPGPAEVTLGSLDYSDLSPVLEIERLSFRAPWSLGTFALELAKPSSVLIAARTSAAGDGPRPVPDGGSLLVGYLICSPYAEIWHLMNVAVAPAHRRRGIARRMIGELIDRLGERTPITLEVRKSNSAAIAMYESLGFAAAGTRPGYYPDNKESALLMWLNPPAGI